MSLASHCLRNGITREILRFKRRFIHPCARGDELTIDRIDTAPRARTNHPLTVEIASQRRAIHGIEPPFSPHYRISGQGGLWRVGQGIYAHRMFDRTKGMLALSFGQSLNCASKSLRARYTTAMPIALSAGGKLGMIVGVVRMEPWRESLTLRKYRCS